MTTPDAPRTQEPVEVDPRTLPPPVAPPVGAQGQPPGPPAPRPYGPYPPQPPSRGPYPGAPGPQYGGPPYPGSPYGGPPYGGPGVPAPVSPRVRSKPPVLPTEPAEFQQMLRTPRHRWWKPLLTLALFAAMAFVAINLGAVVLTLVSVARGVPDPAAYLTRVLKVGQGGIGPVSFLFLNYSLIVLIPVAMLARWIVYRQRPRFLTSVTGGFRWRWMARCLVVTLPIWAIYIGVSTVVDGTPEPKPAYWGALVVVCLVTTPLQCAGEEYTFRGLVLQTVGSWFRRPMVGLIVGAVPAVGLFAAAHGSPDPYILAQLCVFAVSCVIVTWRTGGLEAAIAIHLSNNVLLLLTNIVYGGWNSAFIDGQTTGTLAGVLIDVVVDGTAVALILWQAKRVQLTRRSLPVAEPTPTAFTSAPQPLYG